MFSCIVCVYASRLLLQGWKGGSVYHKVHGSDVRTSTACGRGEQAKPRLSDLSLTRDLILLDTESQVSNVNASLRSTEAPYRWG